MASRNFFASVYLRLYTRIVKSYDYCVNGVWQDTKQNPFVNIVKILNLSVRSFLDKNLQVIDMTASILARDNHMPLRIFDLNEEDSIIHAASGAFNGTTVTVE